MRALALPAALAATTAMIAIASVLPAHAQRASTLDAANVAGFQARLSNPYTKNAVCRETVPFVARANPQPSRARLRRLAETAQACWNVEPNVMTAAALARTLERLGDAQAADAAMAAAAARFPDSGYLFAAQAGRAARAGMSAEAGALTNRAVAAGPPELARDPDRWSYLADHLFDGPAATPLRLRVYDEAWRLAERRRDRTEKTNILNGRARLYLETGRPAEALADASRALEFSTERSRPLTLLLSARAKKALGDLEGARADYAAGVALSVAIAASEQFDRRTAAAEAAPAPCRIAARAALDLYHEAEGDTDAISRAADACAGAGHRAMGLALRAAELSRVGDHAAALALADEAIGAGGAYAYAHAVRGAILKRTRRYPEARTALDRALELEPDNPRYLTLRAAIRIHSGDREGARADQERALAREPVMALAADYVRNLVALADHRCALAAIESHDKLTTRLAEHVDLDLLNWSDEYTVGAGDISYLRRETEAQVNKAPRDQRACSVSTPWGSEFAF